MTVQPKLSERERAVLEVLVDAGGEDDFGYLSFRGIAARGNIDLSTVRRSVRALARKGFAQFEKGLWSDDGTPRGSGYCATREAISALQPKDGAK
jgi:DNA-binding MurR/RpiR family transcriptional regulator